MGILQKMLLILLKVDPKSIEWLSKQISKIENIDIRKKTKEKLIGENVNYIHKIGIIQNAIYGVDIQPIAIEISKLRFFLSLIVDEKVDDAKENRGIEPLPNLEFKFVCANSLIGLAKNNEQLSNDEQQSFFEADDDIGLLKNLRDEYLRSWGSEKKRIEKKFQETQSRMFKHGLSWGGKDSQTLKLSQWNPFSDEACAWFDMEWMFGVKDGFDIVIANPPYKVLTKNNIPINEHVYYIKHYKAIDSSYSKNLFTLFIEHSMKLLRPKANLSYIVPEGLFKTRSYKGCVDLMEKEGDTKSVVTFTDYVFENAVTGNLIFLFEKGWRGETSYFHFDSEYELNKIEVKENKVIAKIKKTPCHLKK